MSTSSTPPGPGSDPGPGPDPGRAPTPAAPGSPALRRAHARARRQLDTLLELARGPRIGVRAPAVSGWSVSQHVEHLALSDRGVLSLLDRLAAGPIESDAPGITLAGRTVLLLDYIPRGAARAIERIQPRGLDPAELAAALTEIHRRLAALAPHLGAIERHPGRFKHPVFGGLNGRQWVRFLGVHHHHHWKIIRDILAAAP